jgi:hypothetical protein
MIAHKPLLRDFGFFLFFSCLCAATLSAQIANSCPPVPADPNLSKVACLRLFYNGFRPITLVRAAQGLPPAIIDTNIPSETYSPYQIMKPTAFALYVLDGKVSTAPSTLKELKEKSISEPVIVRMPAGSFRTLVILERNGTLSANVLEDAPAPSSGAPKLRVLDLSGLEDWEINLLDSRDRFIKTIWQSGMKPENIPTLSAGVFHLLVIRKVNGVTNSVANLECELQAGNLFSILLLPGIHNQGNAVMTFDGTLGAAYDASSVKDVADSLMHP